VRRAGTTARHAVRLGAVLLTLAAAALLSAGPASASNPLGPSENADPGEGLSGGDTLLYFVLVPFLGAAVIAVLYWVPGMRRVPRYRPGRSWSAAPVWFIGPPEPVAAVEAVSAQGVPAVVRGGASGSW
jgi:hypothetical protein